MKVKPYAFTGTGAAIGAVAGGPIGLAVGAGAGALIDWWRRKHVLEAPIIQQPNLLGMLPMQMQQNPYAPATLAAIHLQKLKMKPPTKAPSAAEVAALKACQAKAVAAAKAAGAKYAPATTLSQCQAQVTVWNGIAQAKAALAKATQPQPPVGTADGSASGSIDLSASGGFSF